MVDRLIMGRFRVLDRIGSGGMGTVYRAFDERLERQVAVKELVGVDARRVLREAQAAARLNHSGIVTLYELGSEDGRALLVSELVEGVTLAELARSGDLSDREVAEFGTDVCAALAHAHKRGVIHRDLKPNNVVVRDDDGAGRRAKLMDFGIAAVAGASTLTATGEVVGTLAYMAPEQAAGERVREPGDVYSLALSLFECWAGANPVAGETPVQTAREIGSPLPSLGEYRPDLPDRLISCIDACLDPDPGLRPQLGELHRELQAARPDLDGARSVPARDEGHRRERLWALRVAQLLALCAWAITVGAIAAVGGRPGLALALGALSAPAILISSRLPWAAAPALASGLGALSAGAAYPAIAGSRGTAVERAALGALGWCWLLSGAAALDLGSRLGLLHAAPPGWSRSTHEAAGALLVPLLDPRALLGAAVFALAAVLLGLVLHTAHLALALLGALLWSAGLEAALRVVGDGGLAGRPALIAGAAVAAVTLEFVRRAPRPTKGRAPIPSVRAAIARTRAAPTP